MSKAIKWVDLDLLIRGEKRHDIVPKAGQWCVRDGLGKGWVAGKGGGVWVITGQRNVWNNLQLPAAWFHGQKLVCLTSRPFLSHFPLWVSLGTQWRLQGGPAAEANAHLEPCVSRSECCNSWLGVCARVHACSETVYIDMDRQFLPSLGPRATASAKRRRPLPLKAAVLLPGVDGQSPSEVRLCLKKSGSFHIYRFLTQYHVKKVGLNHWKTREDMEREVHFLSQKKNAGDPIS